MPLLKPLDRRLWRLKDRTETDLDLVALGENTGCLYLGAGDFFKRRNAGRSGHPGVGRTPGRGWSASKVITSDEANVLIYGQDLRQHVFLEVSDPYRGIEAQRMYGDDLVTQLVRAPQLRERCGSPSATEIIAGWWHWGERGAWLRTGRPHCV